MSVEACVYQARYVFPGDGGLIPGGILAVAADRIAYVGLPDGRVVDVDFGNAAITPGFVNAHTHLELGGLRGRLPPPASFADWLRQVVTFRRSQSEEELQAAVRQGVQESLAAGVTLVGDISTRGLSWAVLAQSPLAAVVFYELIGMRPERVRQAQQEVVSWLNAVEATAHCRPGLSPHAPYTTCGPLYGIAADLAQNRCLPVATHWLESKEEREFRLGRGGPLQEFLEEMGAWESAWDPLSFVDIRCLQRWFGRTRLLLAHVNYPDCDWPPDHQPMVAVRPRFFETWNSRARPWAVAYCPRTHAYFGHDPHPFRDFMAAGVCVCFGTDSLASAPSLSVLDEMRFLCQQGFSGDPAALLRMGTGNGAWALGFEDQTGSLTPGKWADFAAVALPDRDEADPYGLLFDSRLPVQATFVRGQRVSALVREQPAGG